jgi:hypothetical protein
MQEGGSRFKGHKIGKALLSVWDESDMRKASLTPAASLIGMYDRDAISQGAYNL